jgi:hypothetical protein
MKIPTPIKLILSLVISGLFLFLIYRKIDFTALAETLRSADRKFFWIYISLFIPQIVVAAYRWRFILARINHYPVSFYRAFQMVVGSYSANLVIPAKMGEVVRVFWVDKSRSRYKPIVVILYEKVMDILAVYVLAYAALFFLIREFPLYGLLSSWASLFNIFVILAIAGLLIVWFRQGFRPESRFSGRIASFIVFIAQNSKVLFHVAWVSVALWTIQLLQFYFMFRVFDIQLSIPMAFAGGGLGVLAGAMIISIGGVGPRDAAILWFYAGTVSKETLVSVGIISVFRIIVPALIGMPFFINLSLKQSRWKRSSGKN